MSVRRSHVIGPGFRVLARDTSVALHESAPGPNGPGAAVVRVDQRALVMPLLVTNTLAVPLGVTSPDSMGP